MRLHGDASQVVTEDIAARLLEWAGLPVARGHIARSAEEAVQIAGEIGFKVAMKAISPAITHRASAGLVALDIGSPDAVAWTFGAFQARAAKLNAELDGVWVQHMFPGSVELLITAFRDPEFGIFVGVRHGCPEWRRHLDEVFVKINGRPHDLWRAVDHAGEILEAVATKRRNRKAALDFLKRLMKKYGRPQVVVTDKVRSYGAAMQVIGNAARQECTGRWINNRAEN